MKKNNFSENLIRWFLFGVMTLTVVACSKWEEDNLVPDGQLPTTISTIAHYGKGIGVSELYINGRYVGHSYDGWGEGSEHCCMTLPMRPVQPLMVTVKWKTYRTAFKEERWHGAIVPVNFAVPSGKGNGLNVHLLPGHRVEIWHSRIGLWDPEYPGPKYPFGPAPDYVPLPNESPEPKKEK